MKVCPACAVENDESSTFCAGCGAYLDWDAQAGQFTADRRGSSRFEPPPAAPVERTSAEPTVTEAKTVPGPADDRPSATTDASPPATDVEIAPPAPPPSSSPPPPPPPPPAPARTEVAVAAVERAAPPEPEVTKPPEKRASEPAVAAPAAVAEPEADVDQERAERMRRLVARSRVLPAAAPPESQPRPPASARPPSAPGPAPAAADNSLATVIKIAERAGRTDLAARLVASREGIRRTGVTVAIVGEFKKGKSNLVNALVNAEVCPSDPVYATVAPIVVTHGDELAVTVTYLDGEIAPIDLADLADLSGEAGNPDNRRRVAQVDVELPRRLLASGLAIVDTPGVGGLDSALGTLTLAGLEASDGVLFVTDCSQELTAPELRYLQAAHERCEATICVMTKLDLHHSAFGLARANRGHLDRAGLDDVPIICVSSVLHLLALAQGDPEMEHESRFEELFDALHKRIWEPARRRGLAAAGHQLDDVGTHLAIPLEAERRASSSEAAAEQTIRELAELQDRVRQFRTTSSRWQQRLTEGMQDAIGDLDHDLRTRIRVVSRTAEGRIESEDVVDDLVFEAWLQKAAFEAVVAHYQMIIDRATALADEIAHHFLVFDREAAFHVDTAAPMELLGTLHVTREPRLVKDGLVRRIITTGQGYSSGIVLASSVISMVMPIGILFRVLSFAMLPVAGFMARRAFSDDRDRRRAARRQELKRLATRYLDEIVFVVQKDSRDTVRRLHRDIREHYTERTEQLERTLQQAAAAAERARAGAASTDVELDREVATVQQLQATAGRLVAAAPLAS